MNTLQKHLMILGAGPFQTPAIRKAVALGYRVTTVDYLPDNIGHSYSHNYVNCSTPDKDCVLAAARELDIDGICTFSSDIAIPTVGHVCDELGLPGVSHDAALTMSSKHLFRAFLEEKNLPHPKFIAGRSFEEIETGLDNLRFPVIVKPVDTSGSRGTAKVDMLRMNGLAEALAGAQHYSRSGYVCVEEFLEGVEVGGDGYLIDGRFAFIAITRKHLDRFVVTGHDLPTDISPDDQHRLVEALETCCASLGYAQGPLNFDVMVAPDSLIILEMSARNGGNGIPSVIARATGVDVEELTLRGAAGDPLGIPDHGDRRVARVIRPAGSYVFGSMQGGVLSRITSHEELTAAVPEVLEFHPAVQLGGEVLPFEHNGNMIGFVLFDCSGPEGYYGMVEKIDAALGIQIDTESHSPR